MNKKQWDKHQADIAMAQKQAAKEAKMAMLGVEPKEPKPTFIEWPSIKWIVGADPSGKADPNGKAQPVSYYSMDAINVEFKIDTAAFESAMAEMSKAMLGFGSSVSTFSAGWNGIQRKSVVGQLSDICPTLTAFAVACPECQGTGFGPLSNLIPHINDHHKWSRERIADWLETLDVDLTVKPIEKETEVAKPSISSEIKTESIFGPGKPLTWSVGPTALGKSKISDLYENLVGNTS